MGHQTDTTVTEFPRSNSVLVPEPKDTPTILPLDDPGKEGHGGIFCDIELDLIATLGEFIGTICFLVFGLGAIQAISGPVAAAQKADGLTADAVLILSYYYKSAAFGMALFASSSIFYRFTGSIMNPSVGLALCLIGVMKPLRFVMTSCAQLAGGIVATAILYGITPGELEVSVKLSQGTTIAQGVFIEMVITATLCMSVLMLSAEKHVLTPFAPLGFGFTLFMILLFSLAYTGGSANVARAFGPACFEGFPRHHWIYWLSPTLGALMSVGIYYLLKRYRYWRVAPTQDSTDARHAPWQNTSV